MKFKAFLTENRVNLLEKRFLPAFDKGKTCHLFLAKDHLFFLHNLLNCDGVQCIAQFQKDVLFDDYRISSQNEDRIAFSLDVSLLYRAVKSSVSICTEFSGGLAPNRLQIKLVKNLPPNTTQPISFLTFGTKGYKSAAIQDVPIYLNLCLGLKLSSFRRPLTLLKTCLPLSSRSRIRISCRTLWIV